MSRSLLDFWNETIKIPEARWIVAVTILVVAVLVAVYVSMYFRNMAYDKGDLEPGELLTDFRKMRDDGHLDDDEFKKLKSIMHRDRDRTDHGNSADQPVVPKRILTLAEAEQLKRERGEQ